MLVLKQKIDNFMIKVFSTKIGYHYKIYRFGEKQVIAQSYVYFHNMDDCYKRMWADIEMLKVTVEDRNDN